jgi:hypothetical protein
MMADDKSDEEGGKSDENRRKARCAVTCLPYPST